MRALTGSLRLFLYALLCLVGIPLQCMVLLFTRGRGASLLPRWFHKIVCLLFHIRVEVKGTPIKDRPVIFVSNHISYLDIEAIGSVMRTSFIAKNDVADWPLFGLLAKLQQTLFISRDPRRAQAERARFVKALERPVPLVLFAEGTSSNGGSILPFKSSLFDIFLDKNIRHQPLIQPLTLSLLAVDDRPATTPAIRDHYAYYGETVLLPHLWRFAGLKGARLRLTFHEPLDPAAFEDRKALAGAAQASCARGLEFAKQDGTTT